MSGGRRAIPSPLLLLLAAFGGTASPVAAARAPLEPPVANAEHTERPPTIDGRVLGDPAWADVPALTRFWQTAPDEGAPASQRTEVRILYTDDALYFGVVCYDDDPDGIVVNESRRDSSLEDTDSFQIVLDTYLDRQNGFVFGTNPAGLEYDGQVTNEGEGGTGLGSSLGGLNTNWDTSWTVEAVNGHFGWSAEFAIPFSSLRYDGEGAQTWGLNLERNIRRRNEQAYWAPIPRQYNLFRLSRAGTLVGLEPPSARNLKLVPYALGKAAEKPAQGLGRASDVEVGGDLKWSVRPGLVLDLTANTDFAQVEVDEEQINLDRFSLFYPEKRPFFLENAGFFTMGTADEVDLFFSRRIGIGPEGEVVPILAGARLSGKLGGFDVGLLDMQTRTLEGVTPANNFAVARVSRELPNRSRVGAMVVNRQGTGDLSPSGDRNLTFGADGRWGLGRYGALEGYVAKTDTPGLAGDDHAYNLRASLNAPSWTLEGGYTEVGEDFNPEVGFLERRGYRKPQGLILYRYRPRHFLGLLELRPHVSYEGYWKPDGFQETGRLHVDNHWQWRSGWELHTGVNFRREGVLAAFEIYPGVLVPPGRYDFTEAQLVGITDQGAPLSVEARVFAGGFFGGHRTTVEAGLRGRVGESFNAYVDYVRNDVKLPGGSFATDLLKVRLSYSFTTRLYVQSLLQYNSVVHNWSTNLRLGWLQTANTGLFVVYNENRDPRRGGVGLRDRSVTVKYGRSFDLLR
jgi:hypothetical protein